jgi:hypothetical protein
LLKQMLDLGISRWHPDPLGAIEVAKMGAEATVIALFALNWERDILPAKAGIVSTCARDQGWWEHPPQGIFRSSAYVTSRT